VVARLRDEFVAGRLSQETFLHRMHVVLETKRQADLPPLLADLPARPHRARSLAGWFRQTWDRLSGAAGPAGPAQPPAQVAQRDPSTNDRWTGPRTGSPARGISITGGLRSVGAGAPLALQFPPGPGTQFSIGRDASCDLAIADMTVSRRHATLERTGNGWLLSDLESTNGTRVNGWRVRGKVPVKVGDLVSFGNLETIFAGGGAELPPPAPA
jgi:hypothetical protein